MTFAELKNRAEDFFSSAGFITHISNESDYQEALRLMDELIEDYDRYLPLIELLSISIKRWENESEEFADFNQAVDSMDTGVAALRVLMDQNQLSASDLQNEIGGKSLVSLILSGKRNLTVAHIKALSERFGVSSSLFLP